MADRNEIVKLAVDLCNDSVNTKFTGGTSRKEQMEILRNKLVEINGGTKLKYKNLRDNTELFKIIETILEGADVQGFEESEFLDAFVDYRNVALGDQNDFYVEDNSLFVVANKARGIGSTLRQRINKGTNVTVPTEFYDISAYAEAQRLLSGRIDIVEFIEKIKRSFKENRLSTIYSAMYAGLNGIPAAFKHTGTFLETNLMNIISHVEAATGETAMLVGTKTALSKITTAVVSDEAKERYAQMGFYGVFNGTDMLMMKQSHKVGTYDFAISDNDIWVITNGNKFIKFVTEGETVFEVGSITDNADRTVDIVAGESYGVAIAFNKKHGQYRIS